MRSELPGHDGHSTRLALTRLALTGLALALGAGEAAAQVQVTALEGATSAGGSPLSLHADVQAGVPLEVARHGRCSLLVADRAVVRLCSGARARFESTRGGAPVAIDLRDGALALVALDQPEAGPLAVRTPAARLDLMGSAASVQVTAGSGETVVRALHSPVRVSRPDGKEVLVVAAGQQLTLRPGQAPGAPRALSPQQAGSCLGDRGPFEGLEDYGDRPPPGHRGPHSDYRAALRMDRAILAAALPGLSGTSGASGSPPGAPVGDLRSIVQADFPKDGLPLEAVAAPSALVVELSKRGANEEVCDPITCNPVYEVQPPGTCGVPPQRGCIP